MKGAMWAPPLRLFTHSLNGRRRVSHRGCWPWIQAPPCLSWCRRGSQDEMRCASRRGEASMTIQDALHKAVEGGYHMHGSDGADIDYVGANAEFSAWTRRDTDSSFLVPVEE